MARSYIRGITLAIGGDTTGLNKAFSDVDKKTKSLQSELKEVERLLKLDPTNTELLAQKQDLLSKRVENTKGKLAALKEVEAKVQEQFKKGTIAEEQYRAFQREVVKTENELKNFRQELESTREKTEETASEIKELGNEAGNSGKKIGGFGERLTGIGKKGIATIASIAGVGTALKEIAQFTVDAAEETREYREDMNRLETAFVTSKKSVQSAKKSYKDFYVILGESDRSVEAVNHLAKLCNTEEELAMWSDICAGVSATFGDSLPIEGLTEASNETAKTAKVTGVLADALNWVGISEDVFNEKLEKCSTEQQRSQLITQTLNAAYQESSEKFREMNASVIVSREATQRLTEAQAKLGAVVDPILTTLKNKTADLAESVLVTFGVVKEGTAKIVDETEKFTETQKKTTEAIDENTTQQLSQIAGAERLYNELTKLTDENGRVKDSDVARAQYIVGELNDALGLEIQMNGNVVSSLGEVGKSIDEIILKKQANILLNSQEEKYAEAIKNITEARRLQTEAATELAEKQQSLNALEDEFAKTQSVNTAKAITQLEAEIRTLQAAYDESSQTVNQYSTDIETYTTASAEAVKGNVEGVIAVLDKNNSAYEKAAVAANESAEQQIEAAGQYYFEAVVAAKVAADNFEAVRSEENEKALNNAIQMAADAKERYESVGGSSIDGWISGINKKRINLLNTLGNIASESIQRVKNTLDIHSPSRVFRDEVGKMIVEGIEVGIVEEGVQLKEEMDKLLKDLDLKRDAGAISEAEYYRKLEHYRDEYFTKGTEGWWKYTLQIIDFENKQLEQQEKILKEQKDNAVTAFKEIASTAEATAKEIQSAQAGFADKLKGYGSLYETTTNTIVGGAADGSDIIIKGARLTSLKDNIKILNEYTSALKAVRDKGVPQGFFNMLRDMGIEEGTAFAKAILNTPEDELQAYINDWSYIQSESERVSKAFYSDEANQIAKDTYDAINAWGDGLPEEWKENGKLTAASFGDGLLEELTKLEGQVKTALGNLFAYTQLPAFAVSGNLTSPDTGAISQTFHYENNFYGDNVSPSDVTRALRQNEKQAGLF